MHFSLPELRVHKTLQKKDQFDPATLLGPAPDSIAYSTPISADAKADLVGIEVLITGMFQTEVKCTCSRCLTVFSHPVKGSFRQDVPATEDVVDADPFIKEAVLFELPIKALCREACRGICPTCGVNRNEKPCSCAEQKTHPQWDALKNFPLH